MEIDAIYAAINDGSDDDEYDWNTDGVMNELDMDYVLEQKSGTVRGDNDVDGDVDFSDFLNASQTFGPDNAGWINGDSEGNGTVEFVNIDGDGDLDYHAIVNSSRVAAINDGFGNFNSIMTLPHELSYRLKAVDTDGDQDLIDSTFENDLVLHENHGDGANVRRPGLSTTVPARNRDGSDWSVVQTTIRIPQKRRRPIQLCQQNHTRWPRIERLAFL